MSTLRIDYDPRSQKAKLSAGEGFNNAQWSSIRRLCEERCPEVENLGLSSLMLPWWRFLSIRESLKYVLSVHQVDRLDVSLAAKELLQESLEREKQYRSSGKGEPSWTEESVRASLKRIGFVRDLMPYQARNIVRLLELPSSATFSVPGSGKTTEALAAFFLTRKPEDRLFIIGPKNAFATWEDELKACVPESDFTFERLTGGISAIRAILKNNPPAVLISYHQLPRVMEAVLPYLYQNPVYIFIDESHRMKRGIEGVHGSTILGLSSMAKRKLLLTGTPMPNSKADLIPQFAFLYPELQTDDRSVIEMISRVYVRTTKSELGLPEPIRVRQQVPMGDAQQRLYDLLASDAGRHLIRLPANDRIAIRRFARCVQHMLQAVSNPSLLAHTSIASYGLFNEVLTEGLAPKLKEACRLARNWVSEGHKVLIWSFFVNTVEHLAGLLADIGADYIHGGVNVSEDEEIWDSREAKIKRFKDPDSSCKVLIANPAACAESISLHQICHRAIYVDRNYNAGQYLQSEDRIHRIGLPPGTSTYVTILHSAGTIDDSVDRRLESKVSAMRAVLNDPSLNITPIDLEDDTDGLDESDIEDLKRLLGI
jgi:SNF2 family DNA or RNA helicase